MNHWIRHTDLSSWKKFAPVVFLTSRIAAVYAATLKGSTAGAVIERGSLSAPRAVSLALQSRDRNDTRKKLPPLYPFSFPIPIPETQRTLYRVSLNEARPSRLRGPYNHFPRTSTLTTHDPGVFGERIESALCLKHRETCPESTSSTRSPISVASGETKSLPSPKKALPPSHVFTRYVWTFQFWNYIHSREGSKSAIVEKTCVFHGESDFFFPLCLIAERLWKPYSSRIKFASHFSCTELFFAFFHSLEKRFTSISKLLASLWLFFFPR